MKDTQRQFVTILKKRFGENQPLIQILMGPRQVGKTTGVLQFLDTYEKPYHYANGDALLYGDSAWILEQWQAALLKGKEALLVIDEIQKIDDWADHIKKLWDEQKIKKTHLKVLLLGSSSLSLAKRVKESLAGRFEITPVYHWDYVESNKLYDMTVSDFLKIGGYPRSYDYRKDADRWMSYVKHSIVDRVIDKDILQYAVVKKPALFRQIFEILCCYPAQEISYRKLLGQLQDKGNTDLIKYYLSLFEGAFLIKTLQKYSHQEFKIKSSSPKILLLAPCFYTVFSTHLNKQDFVFEGTIGAKLLQVTDTLYYWREGNLEVDFIAQWRHRLIAIEVKSGKIGKTSGLKKFITKHPEAIPIVITPENYVEFITDPVTFFERLT